jgi:hypothetical protein
MSDTDKDQPGPRRAARRRRYRCTYERELLVGKKERARVADALRMNREPEPRVL